jgi:DNA processing protein
MIEPYSMLRKVTPGAGAEAELARWLALSHIKGLGSVSCKKLAAHFGDPTRAFSASPSELSEIDGLQRQAVTALVGFSQWDKAASEVRRIYDAGVSLVRYTDEDYPERLRAIADPPPLLYVKGKLAGSDEKAVAIVGSRSASNYGKRVARDLARGLASCGFTVISGMARGIDGMAHESALEAGGPRFGRGTGLPVGAPRALSAHRR